eukprot:Gb_20604 [translate_table: standard]
MAYPKSNLWVRVAWLAFLMSSGLAGKVPASFIFGDSLTDVGNNNYLTLGFAKSNYPWYGIDFNGGVPTGRFTNGRTIGDIISEKMGAPSPPAYLSLSANDDAMLAGVNYASGGAGILNETGFYFIQKLSFDTQIEYFGATRHALTKKIGAAAAEKLISEALCFVGIGSNDYINNFLLSYSVDAQLYAPEQFIDLLIVNLRRQLTKIHEIGARKIIFNGLAPMGCIPSQRLKSGECREEVNAWAGKFNGVVKKLLGELNSQLPGVKITFADTYSIVMKLIQNPQAYGFNVSDAPCCNIDTTFGQFCLPNSKLCSDRSKYVFWDAFHPTDAANEVIAEILISEPDVLQYRRPSKPASPPPSRTPSPSPGPVADAKTPPPAAHARALAAIDNEAASNAEETFLLASQGTPAFRFSFSLIWRTFVLLHCLTIIIGKCV